MPFISSVRGSLSATGRGVRRRSPPVWATAAGALTGSPTFDSQRTTKSYTVSATADPGETISYSVTSGSLPTGMSLTSANGFIGGTASAVGSNTTSTFDITATSTGGTAVRSFSIEVKAPQITSFTATGAATFTVPTGVTAVDVLVVAGGGGGSNQHAGGGGGGGLIYRPGFPVSPGSPYPVAVGGGGVGAPVSGNGQPGQNSNFSTLTAIGGGGSGQGWQGGGGSGLPGGSGGGAGAGPPTGPFVGGTGTQPTQPGDSGGPSGYGFGFPGGFAQPGRPMPEHAGGGGGGAGGAGDPGPIGDGGAGRPISITGSPVLYAGGGGGGGHNTQPAGAAGPGGGGAGGDHPSGTGQPGTANRGGGGGGGGNPVVTPAGSGGSGIVIVRF